MHLGAHPPIHPGRATQGGCQGPLSSSAAATVQELLTLQGQLEGLLEASSQQHPSWIGLSANSLWGALCPTLPPSQSGVLQDRPRRTRGHLPFSQVNGAMRIVPSRDHFWGSGGSRFGWGEVAEQGHFEVVSVGSRERGVTLVTVAKELDRMRLWHQNSLVSAALKWSRNGQRLSPL